MFCWSALRHREKEKVKMKIGLQVYHFDWPGNPHNMGPKLVEIAKTAERAGFYSLWIMDHFFQLGGTFGPPEAPVLEGYSTISYLAAVTRQIKVGLMVTNNICRHPGVLVKIVSTLDVLSGGRAYLGIGAGGQIKREGTGLGIPFPSNQELIERLEEALQIVHQMWRGDVSPYNGKHYQLAEPINSPQPLSKPHPPILIGLWKGGPKMLRLVAKYGDACNLQFGTPLKEFPSWLRERYEERQDYLTRNLAVLKAHCSEIGRSYDEIERTVLGTIQVAPEAMNSVQVIELCRELAGLGFQHIIFNMPNVHEIEPLDIIGREVIPQVANL